MPEESSTGRPWRESLLNELDHLVMARRAEADAFRQKHSSTPEVLRRVIVEKLGWPLLDFVTAPPKDIEETFVLKDELGTIQRLKIPTLPGVSTYALLCLPPGSGPFPAVIAQHGGRGTPEMLLGLTGSSHNYRDFGQRLRARKLAVLAPQLCLFWGEEWGPERDQYVIDNTLRHLGGSLAALETYRLRRCLDYLETRQEIAEIGIAGLSYGGFYTLLTAALDERVRAAYSSCFLNQRYAYPWGDLVWPGSAFQFMDAEIGGLIAPRSLYVDIGQKDEVFRPDGVEAVAEQIRGPYRGHGDNFVFHIHSGGHEFDPGDAALDFLEGRLRA